MNIELRNAIRLYQAGDLTGALALCDRFLQKTKDNEVLHLKVLCLTRLNKINDALLLIEGVAVSHPNPDVIWVDFGNTLKSVAKFGLAVDAYSRALAHNKKSQAAHGGLALALHENGRSREAIETLTKAVGTFPNNPKMQNNLGVLLNKEGRYEEAVSFFSKAIECNPQLASAYVNRGRSYRELGQFDRAIADGKRGVTLSGKNSKVDALYQLANSLRVAGKVAEALSYYETAISIAPTRADLQGDIARLKWENGEGKHAFRYLDKAIKDTRDPRLMLDRAEFALISSDLETAHRIASNIVDAGANLPLSFQGEAFAILSKLALDQNQKTDALVFAGRAVDAAPGNYKVLHQSSEVELACEEFERVRDRLSGDAPREHLQRHMALRCIALRALSDPMYQKIYDFDRFVREMTIETPDGYPSLEEFNAALEESIRRLHLTNTQPLDQTLFGGTQSFGTLWRSGDPVIQDFAKAMRKTFEEYVCALPDDPIHPFLRRKVGKWQEAGSWSVILNSGGGHVDHIHPAGWVSASYYVRVPSEVVSGELGGCLRLGGAGIQKLRAEPPLRITPTEGTVVFFPSYMWHGVDPFHSKTARIAAPFDFTSSI